MRENLNHTRVEAPQEALPSQAAVVPPTDGEYQSQAGHSVKVARRPVPDSREGSIEIAVIYGRGGSGREFYCLEHHTTIKARLRSYCQKLWIGRACGYDVDGRKEESVSSG